MWRSSLKLRCSSRIFSSSSNPNPNPNFLSSSYSISVSNGVIRPQLFQSYHPCASSSTASIPSSESKSKLGFVSNGSEGTRAFASTATATATATASADYILNTKDVVDLTRHYARCYWELSKARLSMLVVATSGTGYVLGSGGAVDIAGLCLTCSGTMMVAASANSLNQVFEIKNDAKMKRTMGRPLPTKRISVPHALTWASSVGIAGTALLACKTNMLAAGLGASNLVLYAFVYTPLKQIHPVNTWVGAVVGAIPPLLGWAAASGQVSLNAMILPAALYFWQIPHFMALAYLCRNDYAAGGYRMISLADASGKRTAAVALRNCAYLVPLGVLAYDWGITTGWFAVESTLLTMAIAATAFSFYRNRTTKKARKMFHASLLYLPVFMSGLIFHQISDNQLVSSDNTYSQTAEKESENVDWKEGVSLSTARGTQARPVVAYASVAPFPFLPAPSFYEA